MKRFISVCVILTLCIMTLSFNVSAGVLSDGCVKLVHVNEPLGGIYKKGEKPKFRIIIVNPESTQHAVTISYTLEDGDGNVVREERSDVDLMANSQNVRHMEVPVNDFGIYEFKVAVSGDFGEISTSSAFSVIDDKNSLSEKMGVQMHLCTPGVETAIDESVKETADAGFGWIRDDVRWWSVETGTTPDKYVLYDALLEYIPAFLEDGRWVHLALGTENPLYDNGNLPSSPAGIQAYADFCGWVAGQYVGKNVSFEIGNEPDNESFSGWETTGADYAKLVLAASAAIENANPDAIIVGGALCNMSSSTQQYLDDLLAVEGVTDAIDALSFHPYDMETYKKYSDENSVTFMQQLEIVKEKLAKHGAEDMPIWVTEYGSPSIPSQGLTERHQASNLVRTVAMSQSEKQLKRFSVFNFREKDSNVLYLKGLSIVDSEYKPKSAYIALSFLNDMLDGAEYKERYADGDLGYSDRVFSGVRFDKDSTEDMFILWGHTGESVTVKAVNDYAEGVEAALIQSDSHIEIHTPENMMVKFYDMFGNELGNGDSITFADEPIYARCIVDAGENVNIDVSDSGVKINGKTEAPGSYVSVYAVDEGQLEKEVFVLDQKTSDENGNFEFNIGIENIVNKAFSLYVFDGSVGNSTNFGESDYGFDVQWLINEAEVQEIKLSELNENDQVSVKLNITDKNKTGEKLMFYGALYGRDGALRVCDIDEAEWMSDKAECSVNIDITDVSEIEKIRLFVFDDNIQPVVKSKTIQ